MEAKADLHTLFVQVGRNIRYLREERNISQEVLADDVGIPSQAMISQYETASKQLSLARIAIFCEYFGVSIEEMMLQDIRSKRMASSEESKQGESSIAVAGDPIRKCANRKYYGYYLRELDGGEDDVSSEVAMFEVNILEPITSHEAGVELFIYNGSKSEPILGKLTMDGSYAYITCHDKPRDWFWQLTFFYYRTSRQNNYIGGKGLLQRIDHHGLPVGQFCVLSVAPIDKCYYGELHAMLQAENQSRNKKQTDTEFVLSSIIRLSKSRDKTVYNWLKKKSNVR